MRSTQAPALPIKVDQISNGEFRPVPLPEAVAAANALAGAAPRRTCAPPRRGPTHLPPLSVRRPTTLATLNEAFAAAWATPAAASCLPREATLRERRGRERARRPRVHLRRPDPHGRPDRQVARAPRQELQALARFPQGSGGERDPVDCFSAEQYIKHVFLDSDTDLAVLSFVPTPERQPAHARGGRARCGCSSSAWRREAAVPARHGRCRTRRDSSRWRLEEGGGRATRRGLEKLHPVGARGGGLGATTRRSASRPSRRRARSASGRSASTRACPSPASGAYSRCADAGLSPGATPTCLSSSTTRASRRAPW